METQLYINGQWTAARGGQTLALESPGSGDQIGIAARGLAEDIDLAVQAARAAQPQFARQTAFARRDLCHRVADAILARRDALATHLSTEQGKPRTAEALGEIDVTARFFRMAGEDGIRLEGTTIPSEEDSKRVFTTRTPRGVYGVITPWNFPFAIPAQYLGGVLATGNTAVWVPPPSTAGCAALLMECLIEAGVPAGVVNLVTGLGAEVGDALAGHPDIDGIGLTGSSATGAAVARRAAGKPQLLELGGNAPTIVLADADIERAATSIGRGAFWNAGQICDSTERIYVHRDVQRAFVERLLQVAEEFTLGDPLDEQTTLGPVHNAAQVTKVQAHVDDARNRGANVLVGGQVDTQHPSPLYFPATVIDEVPAEALLNVEETFGPVAPVTPFDDVDEALSLANASATGLLAAVFTRDVGSAFHVAERLQAGIVNINECSTYWQPRTPFGGHAGKQSGMGRLGGRAILEEMTQIKSYVLDIGQGE